MRPELPLSVYRLAHRGRGVYWRIFKPETFGVKVALLDDTEHFLAVKHSYVNSARWSLPGGGYKPRKESPYDASRREIRQELGVALGALTLVFKDESTAEGKLDHILGFSADVGARPELRTNNEISEAVWLPLETDEPMHTVPARVIEAINQSRSS